MSGKDNWNWPARPTNEAEYDTMLVDLDPHLALQQLQPAQRSLNAGRLVSMGLKLSGTPIARILIVAIPSASTTCWPEWPIGTTPTTVTERRLTSRSAK